MLPDSSLPERFPLVPHIRQYTAPWAMEIGAAEALLERLRGYDINAHIARAQAKEPEVEAAAGGTVVGRVRPAPVIFSDGIATVSIDDTMTKYGSSFFSYPGNLAMQLRLRALARDDSVKGVIMQVDSPGGSVAGVADLADEVYSLAQLKPVVAVIEDIGASAAYYVASQANLVVAQPAARVGSIGTVLVLNDYSKAFEQQGVRAIVISSGKFKGAGSKGSTITDEQIAEWQKMVDGYATEFMAAVAALKQGEVAALLVFDQLSDQRVIATIITDPPS